MIQKVEAIVEAALKRIGATNIQKKVNLAVKFARTLPSVEVVLDGKRVVGIAVDIATVFSVEGSYRQVVDDNGAAITLESVQALSIVIVGDDVKLCKSTYDVIPGSTYPDAKFINALYWTTSVNALTEKYVC